jgi:predicted nuclease of predicted toxin-antitoxin system
MPSVARSRRLREPFTFFIDRSLGARLVADAIRGGCERGEIIHVHDDHFPQDTTDTEWLKEVGARGWVVLTKDTRMRTNFVEREAILGGHVAWFALARGDLTAGHMGQVFRTALRRIRTVLRRFDAPLIATVRMDGAVTVRYGDGGELQPPRIYASKPRRRP